MGGQDELDDRPHHHSQLYSARAHKDRADWSLVRSLKLLLPLDYGPPSVAGRGWGPGSRKARNVLPRSVVDLARRLLSLRLSAVAGPRPFGAAAAEPKGRGWRTPLDSLDAMQNSMAPGLWAALSARLRWRVWTWGRPSACRARRRCPARWVATAPSGTCASWGLAAAPWPCAWRASASGSTAAGRQGSRVPQELELNRPSDPFSAEIPGEQW